MNKNTIIGFVLIGVIMIGFTLFQSKQYKEQVAIQQKQDSIARVEAAKQVVLDSAQKMLAAADTTVSDSTSVASTATATKKDSSNFYKDVLLDSAVHKDPEYFLLSNDKFDVAFTTKGAQRYSVKIKNYRNYDSTDLYIFKPGMSDYGVTIYTGENINTSDLVFDLAERTDTSIVMRLPFTGGGYIEQKYVIRKGSYVVDNVLSFVGMGNIIPKNVSMFDIDWSVIVPRMEKGYKNEVQYSKLDYYFPEDKKPSEVGRGRNGEKKVDVTTSWFAFQQQFFSAIMRAKTNFSSGSFSINFYPENDASHNLMACKANMRADFKQNNNGVSVPFEFYFGPNHCSTLKSFDQKYEKIIPLGGSLVGWFTKFVIIPLFDFFRRYTANFGLIILLMTIVIKIVVFPLTYKSYASSAKMTALKPEMDKINAKFTHADDQQEQMKKQQATMDLYKRAGVSPMGGCLPTLLTFPILWAMFRFFPASIELRQQPFLWCHDLSAYDSILDYGTNIPILGDHLSLFALLMAVTMWVYSKLTMATQAGGNDANAASMRFMSLWMMPIMMFFICNGLSAALSYYYLLSQMISIFETWIVRKTINQDAILAKVKASEGKPVPKSKWQQRLESAQKMQEQQLKQQQKQKRR